MQYNSQSIFRPHIKGKPYVNQKVQMVPFPNPQKGEIFRGIFTGISVEVFDKNAISKIYDCGFYGKGSKSRGAPQMVLQDKSEHLETDEALVLMVEEAFFLAFVLNVIRIYDLRNEEMDWTKLMDAAQRLNKDFIESLAAYLFLKARGWVVKSGIKFGGYFLIYKKGPRFFHASFLVILSTLSCDTHLVTKNIKGLQRIAETSDKDVLLLQIVKSDTTNIKSLTDFNSINIAETIVKRFNYTIFVQNPNSIK